MNRRNVINIVGVLAVISVVAAAAWLKSERAPSPSDPPVRPSVASSQPVAGDESGQPVPETPAASAPATSAPTTPTSQATQIPRLVDLGAGKCKNCKALAPILDALREEYKGRLSVEFIDVWKNPDAGEPYNIRLIPTQILYDRDGSEVWRHEGFVSKEYLEKLFAEKVGVK